MNKINLTQGPWPLRIAGLIILVLMIGNVFLLKHYFDTTVLLDEQSEATFGQRLSGWKLKAAFEEAQNNLSELRGENDTLNQRIERQKEELAIQYNKIQKLIEENGDPEEIKREIEQLQRNANYYASEIRKLKEQIAFLENSTDSLTNVTEDQLERIYRYRDTITMTRDLADRNQDLADSLEEEGRILAKQKYDLESEKGRLNAFIDQGSVVGVDLTEIVFFKKNGKPIKSKNKKAKNIESLRICYKMDLNTIIPEGAEERFDILIKDPLDQIITENPSQFVTGNSKEVPFTITTSTDYIADGTDCIRWTPDKTLQSGKYNIHFFNKGIEIAIDSFLLR